MTATFYAKLPDPASQLGDTLIEVLISALLVGLIVVGTLTGLDSTTRATALQRARSQANALAEQDEDRLRSEPINVLASLGSHPQTSTVTLGATKYTVESTSAYISDSTATESCTSSSPEADYLQTTSRVTSNAIRGKPVEETGIISPPPGANLIVQVSESGVSVPGATVTATGPAPESTVHTLETSSKGCAVIALPAGGEYSINADKPGYVDPNGYENTDEDESVTQKVYIPAETTAKEGYYLGRAGKIEAKFSGGSEGEGDTFVMFNSGMTNFTKFPKPSTSYAAFGTEGTYVSSLATPIEMYPFTTHYTIYPGTCEADKPPTLTSENEVTVPPGGTGTATLVLPHLKLKVYSGTTSSSSLLTGATGSVTDGCGVKRTFTTSAGAMPDPALPYGTYTLCVTGQGGSPVEQRRYEKTGLRITSRSGVEETVYLGSYPHSAASC